MEEEKRRAQIVEQKLMQPPWKPVWMFLEMLKKKKIDLPYDPSISLLGIFSKMLIPCHRDTSLPHHAHCCCLPKNPEMEAAQTPTIYSRDDEHVARTRNGTPLGCKAKESDEILGQFDGTGNNPSEFTESRRDNCHMFSLHM